MRIAAAVLVLAACSSKKEAPPQQAPAPTEPAAPAPTAPKEPPPPLPPLAADPGGGTGAPGWALPIGGLGSEVARDLAIGPGDDAFVCGDFEDDATFGALGPRKPAGASDAFVLRLAADGTPAWVQTLGGANEETCDAITLAGDRVVVGGLFSDTMTLGDFTAKSNGSDDLYVAALGPDGKPAWLWTTGGKASDTVLAAATARDGGVLVAGGFFGEVPFGPVALKALSHEDAFLAKISPAGDLLWAKRYGGEKDERIVRLAVDAQGSIYALVAFEGKSSFGGEPMVAAGGYDIGLVKLDEEGNHVWSQRLGGVDNDGAVGLAVDPAGNPTLVGSFDQKMTIDGQEYRARGIADVLIVRFDPQGKIAWVRTFGGRGEDVGAAVAADAAGGVVVAGWFEHDLDFGAGKVTSKGNKDIFVARFDAAGALRWAQTFGDRDHDKARAVAMLSGGDVLVAGIFRFTMNLPAPIESVRDPADKAPKTDAYVLRLAR